MVPYEGLKKHINHMGRVRPLRVKASEESTTPNTLQHSKIFLLIISANAAAVLFVSRIHELSAVEVFHQEQS